MREQSFAMLAIALLAAMVLQAQSPTYHLGRTPTPDEIKAVDTYVGPSGKELPPGSGTAKQGVAVFAQKCAHCHGVEGKGEKYLELVTRELHPFPTTIWSMINSSMPRSFPDIGVRKEQLNTDQVYALTAFILFKNGLIREDEVMDAKTLPRVRIPTRDPSLDRLVQPIEGRTD